MARSGFELAKWMQFRRPWLAKEPIPCCGAEPHDAGEILRRLAEADCPQKGCKIRAQRPHGGGAIIARVDSYDQKDRRPRQGRRYRLANWACAPRRSGRGHRIGLHPVVPRRERRDSMVGPTTTTRERSEL